jgi:hypothetical protein
VMDRTRGPLTLSLLLPNMKDTPMWGVFLCSAASSSTRHVNTPCRRVLCVWQYPPSPSSAERERHAQLGVFLVFGALPFNQTRKTRHVGVFYVSGSALPLPLPPSSAERERHVQLGVFFYVRHPSQTCKTRTRRVLRVWWYPPSPSSAERERHAQLGVFYVSGQCPSHSSSAECKRHAQVGVFLVFRSLLPLSFLF